MKGKLLLLLCCVLLKWKNINAQVDIQTGCASYNIPVFAHTDPQSGLSHSISLNYNSGQGIKVNQIASNLGLGWNLLAAGEIVRLVHGEPDDQYNPEPEIINMATSVAEDFPLYGSSIYNKYYPNGYLYKRYSADYVPKQQAFQPRFLVNTNFKMAPMAAEDTEQDEFAFVINGSTKTFVIDKNFQVHYTDRSILKTEIIKEESNDNTLYVQNIITKIKGFIVTDNRGIIYRFDKYELDELHDFGPPNSRGNWYGRTQQPTGKYVINKWVLTSVEDPFTLRKIQFGYTTENWLYVPDICYNVMYQKIDDQYKKSSTSLTIPMAHTKTLQLSSIIFPDNFIVNFSYNQITRSDLTGSAALSAIEIKSGTFSTMKRVELENGYFSGKEILSPNLLAPLSMSYIPQINSNTVTNLIEAYKYRLALTRVNIWSRDNADKQSYTFDYYTGKEYSDNAISVPSRLSTLRDYGNLYCKSHDAAVFYKTGYDAQTEEPAVTDLPESKCGLLKSVKTPINGNVQFDYVRFRLYTQRQYAELVTKVTAVDSMTNTSHSKMYGYPAYTNTGALAPTVYGSNPVQSAALLRGRAYNVVYYKDEDYSFNDGLSGMFISSTAAGIVSALSNSGFFTGFALSFLGSYYMNILTGFLDDLFGSDEVELSASSASNFFLTEQHPLPLLMSQVTEYDVVGTDIFKSKGYFFDWTANYSYPEPALWSSRQLYNPGEKGNLLKIESYDRSGTIVHTKLMEYAYDGGELDDNSRSVFYAATKFYSGPYYMLASANNIITNDWILKDVYHYKTGRSYMTKETEFYNNAAGQKQSTDIQTYYTWNKANHAISQSYAIASDGRITGSNTYYSVDFWNKYPANNLLQKFKARNYIDGVGANISWFRTATTSNIYYITGITLSNYDEESLRVLSGKKFRIGAPIQVAETDITNFDPYNLPTWLTNQNLDYDVPERKVYKNNLLAEVWGNNDAVVSAVKYDFTTGLPSASIVNATEAEVSYTSFESDNQDGWSYNQAAGVSYNLQAATGKYVYALSSDKPLNRSGINAQKEYRLTIWCSGGDIQVNGANGTKLFEVNTWKLYQFIIKNTTSITITGNSNIDEVRLLPSAARMRTTCFDNQTFLKISDCDANNKIQYYEYDIWGRTTLIRDESKNIIKRYCYSQSGKQGGCPELTGGSDEPCEHVYAKLFYENSRTKDDAVLADIVVRFFADEACTRPCQARDLTVNTTMQKNCSGVYVDNYTPSKVANGWFVVVGYGVVKERLVSTCSTCPLQNCVNYYALLEGNGYTAVRTIFKNSEKSQVFTKNDCPATTTPPSITYTVPAGKYTALFSQAEADQLALNDIAANGQNFANQSTCIPLPYAKLTLETSSKGTNYRNVVISFYSDAAATQPLTVSNLVIRYDVTNVCSTGTTVKQGAISGQNYVLEADALYQYTGTGTFPICRYNYVLETSSLYLIAN